MIPLLQEECYVDPLLFDRKCLYVDYDLLTDDVCFSETGLTSYQFIYVIIKIC